MMLLSIVECHDGKTNPSQFDLGRLISNKFWPLTFAMADFEEKKYISIFQLDRFI